VPFSMDPAWSFRELLYNVYGYYTGSGVESTGRRLSIVRMWLSMMGRTRAVRDLEEFEISNGKDNIPERLKISKRTWTNLKAFAKSLPEAENVTKAPLRAFISYKWDTKEHLAWVEKLAAALRASGIDALLDRWEVKLGESFTDYMQEHISTADVILFVITPDAVKAAEAPKGKGGALKFEVQMMNARRIAEGTRIIGVYRSGDRPPRYLRDHRYIDFRDDREFEHSLKELVEDLLERSGPPKLGR
jgi:hypothetical protein